MALQTSYLIPNLPPVGLNIQSPDLVSALVAAHRSLAELKGCASSIPNQAILVNTLVLQEAKASSEVESYVTTQDELFQADLQIAQWVSPAAKEVSRYREALNDGFSRMKIQQGIISNSTLIAMFQRLKNSSEAFRTNAGTVIKNEKTAAIVFVPPQDAASVQKNMDALEQFINNETACDWDPLIKMALIHHQFESIHPFNDGNGRIGRILCVLYLVQTGLLNTPILYLSRYINAHKLRYYELLQAVRDASVDSASTNIAWLEWIKFMLDGVAQTAQEAVVLVKDMCELMTQTKHRIRTSTPKFYSQDLLNNLFSHPYTRIEFVQSDLGVTRQTAARYLRGLAQAGVLQEQTQGKHVYFINIPLVQLLSRSN
ncbi:MAG: hypothetical protein RI956_912 [Pseudomonadota bacterium]|jgi:Fic family protein